MFLYSLPSAVSESVVVPTNNDVWDLELYRGEDGHAALRLFAGEQISWPGDDACQVMEFQNEQNYFTCDFEGATIVENNVFDHWPKDDVSKSVFGKHAKKEKKLMTRIVYFGCKDSCEEGNRVVVQLEKKKFHNPEGKDENSCQGVTSEHMIKTIDMSEKSHVKANVKRKKGKGKEKLNECKNHCGKTRECFGFHFAMAEKKQATCTLYSTYPSTGGEKDPALKKSYCYTVHKDNTVNERREPY